MLLSVIKHTSTISSLIGVTRYRVHAQRFMAFSFGTAPFMFWQQASASRVLFLRIQLIHIRTVRDGRVDETKLEHGEEGLE